MKNMNEDTDGNREVVGAQVCKIIHIPEKPPFLPHLQPTVALHAAVIEPKDANTLVRKLNHIAPLENLRHVKRVRKKNIDGVAPQLSVLLCMADENDDSMPYEILELVKSYQRSSFITKVCKYAATSKEERDEQCKLWPTSYHPPTYNISGITGFSEEESQLVLSFMRYALDLATSCVDQVIGSCPNYPENLKASDLENQQTWLSNGEFIHITNNVSCVHPWGWGVQSSSRSTGSWHPLRHAAVVAIESSAARDQQLFPDYKINEEEDSMLSPLKRQKIKESDSYSCESVRPYLCTGCDIYLAWEPCAMCAMALVHQRVRRIFFSFPNSKAGALGSVHRLQGERSLNHHYAVFRVVLREEDVFSNKAVDAKTAASG